jgi:hypothetical protein
VVVPVLLHMLFLLAFLLGFSAVYFSHAVLCCQVSSAYGSSIYNESVVVRCILVERTSAACPNASALECHQPNLPNQYACLNCHAGTASARSLQQQQQQQPQQGQDAGSILGGFLNEGLRAAQGLINATQTALVNTTNNATSPAAAPGTTAANNTNALGQTLGQVFSNLTTAIGQAVNNTAAANRTAAAAPAVNVSAPVNATGNVTDALQTAAQDVGQFFGNLTGALSGALGNASTAVGAQQGPAGSTGAMSSSTAYPKPGSGAAAAGLSSLVGLLAGAVVLLQLVV